MENPKHIICAVRGGPESRDTITHAINLALETNAWLTFLNIADAEFLAQATISPLSVVYKELIEMGKFAMMILCDRAQRRGLNKVDYQVIEGNIRTQLRQFAMETKAEMMIMGCPVRSPGSNVFKPHVFNEFVTELANEANIEIIQITHSDEEACC